MSDDELDRDALQRLLDSERAARLRAEESLRIHSAELLHASDELLLQADALVERDLLASQMAIARRIQLAVLPPPIVTPSYEVATSMDAAEDVGGDFCDVHLRGDALWLVIGDVSGHGIDAGLVMLMAQSGFALATDALPHASPLELLSHVNRVLYQNIRRRMQRDDHMTFLAARIEHDGRVRCAGAHDLDVLVVRPDGSTRSFAAHGMWLGVRPELQHTENFQFGLDDGDLLVLATDGLVDSLGPAGARYGVTRFVDRVVRARAGRPRSIIENVREDVMAWRAAAPPESARRLDDMTMIVARYVGR